MERALSSIGRVGGTTKRTSKQGKLLEVQRLEQRTRYDIEMMREIGFCQGIENYSRHLSGRAAGSPPIH